MPYFVLDMYEYSDYKRVEVRNMTEQDSTMDTESESIEKLWDINDLAAWAGYSPDRMRRKVKEWDIPRFRKGGRLRFLPSEVIRWFRDHTH